MKAVRAQAEKRIAARSARLEAAKSKAHVVHWLMAAGVVVSLISSIATLSMNLMNSERQIWASEMKRADDARFQARAAIRDQANRCLAVAQLGAQLAAGKQGAEAEKALTLASRLDENCANIKELAAAYIADRPSLFSRQDVARAKKAIAPAQGSTAIRLTDRFFLRDPAMRGFDIRGMGPEVARTHIDDSSGGRGQYQGRAVLEIPLGEGAKELGLNSSSSVDVGEFYGSTPPPRIAIGAGVNWNSPFGPLRIDFAHAVPGSSSDAALPAYNVGSQF